MNDLQDLKRKQEINSFHFEELNEGRCLFICAVILVIGLLFDLGRERSIPAAGQRPDGHRSSCADE